MKKKTATNSFEKGLVMDFNPLVMPEKTYCNALNATLITHNGNENVLQNDMGNGRVETAYLPEGYVPLGTAELGGIIYIVSYNPLINKCQIGSFPSPERNITSDESEGPEAHTFSTDGFYDETEEQDSSGNKIYHINKTSIKLDINIIQDGEELIFNPGDKYMLFFDGFKSGDKKYNYLSAYNEISTLQYQYLPRYLSFQVLAASENGLQFNMTEDNVWLPIKGLKRDGKQSYYYINTSIEKNKDGNYDLDEYRSLVSSNYNVFSSKQSGTLQVALNLECINSFDVSWDAYKLESDEWAFYFYLNWTYNNDKSPDKINLHGIFCKYYLNNSISNQTPDYKKSELIEIDGENVGYPIVIDNEMTLGTTDIMLYQENINNDDYSVTFCTPYYIDALDNFVDQINNGEEGIINPYTNGEIINNGISNFRKNDDSDFQYLLGKPFLVNENAKTNTGEDNIITMEVYPTMPYGVIDYLGTSFNINLAKLGTGQIILTTYKYYIQDSDIIFVYGFEAYPERNKKVKDVTFNFYEIDDPNTANSVGKWIYNNSKCIDEYMLMRYKNVAGADVCSWYDPTEWEKTNDLTTNILSECHENITPEDFSFIDDKESSYSGTFTKTISKNEIGLDNIGKTYIVEINVNYNNEKHICYYRIFYTQPIFNDCYYNDDYLDFKNIELDDYLNISYESNRISGYGLSNDMIYYRKNNERLLYKNYCFKIIEESSDGSTTETSIDYVPTYKTETQTVKYHLDHNFTAYDYTIEAYCTDNYSLFDCDIKIIEVTDLKCEINNDAIVRNYGSNEIEFDNIKYEIIEDEIYTTPFAIASGALRIFPSVYYLNNNIRLNYFVTTHIPITINYNNYETVDVNYEMSNLDYDYYFLCGVGSDKWFYLNLSKYFQIVDDRNFGINVGDDVGKEYHISNSLSIYDTLEDSLVNNNNDIVLLVCGVATVMGTGKDPSIRYGSAYKDSGFSTSNSLKTYKYASGIYCIDGEQVNKYPNKYMILYAVKTKNDIALIGYGMSIGKKVYPSLKAADLDAKGYSGEGLWNNENEAPYCINTSNGAEIMDVDKYLSHEIIFEPFNDYYKLKDSIKTTNIYGWGDLYYYNTFNNCLNFYIASEIELNLYINTTININEFKQDDELYIKNFKYDNKKTTNIHSSYSYKIDVEKYVDEITSNKDRYFVLDKNGKVIYDNDIVSNKIYHYINGLYEEYTSFPNTNACTISYDNQNFKLQTLPISYNCGVAFNSEEQGIALKYVYSMLR